MLRLLTTLFEGISHFVAWLIVPRVILLILGFISIGSLTWYFFDVPAAGVAVKNFILRTAPSWYHAAARSVVRLWPHAVRTLTKTTVKKRVKMLAWYLGILFIAKHHKFLFRNRKKAFLNNAKVYLWDSPVTMLRTATTTLSGKLLVGAVIIALLVSVPGLIILGTLVIPIAYLRQGLILLLSKVGAGTVIAKTEMAIKNLLDNFKPREQRIKEKWKRLRAIVSKQRKIKMKAAAFKLKTAKTLADRSRLRNIQLQNEADVLKIELLIALRDK